MSLLIPHQINFLLFSLFGEILQRLPTEKFYEFSLPPKNPSSVGVGRGRSQQTTSDDRPHDDYVHTTAKCGIAFSVVGDLSLYYHGSLTFSPR